MERNPNLSMALTKYSFLQASKSKSPFDFDTLPPDPAVIDINPLEISG